MGDGVSINVWKDPWIPWLDNYKPRPKDESISLDSLMVSSLIDFSTHSCRQDKLLELFDSDTVAEIKFLWTWLIERA